MRPSAPWLTVLPWVLLLSIHASVSSADESAPAVLTFGVVPQFEARKLASIWVPLLTAVEKETGLRFRMEGAPRIPDFERSFQSGDFDFAYMNPYHSLLALESQGYRPLVRDGDRQLYGILVVNAASDISSVADLTGRRIAFPAPNALGASLLMRADLETLHDLEYEAVYAQTHDSSYFNVLLGEAAAAGGVMATLRRQPPEYQEGLRIIYETRRMAPHPIVAHPRVPPEIVDRVRSAFLRLGETEAGRELLSQVPIRRPVAASVEDYRIIAEWGLDRFFVRSGN